MLSLPFAAQLNPIALRKKRIIYSILLKAASQTLHTLAAREKYFGRYTHRIAIANSRITDITDTTVSFRWKDYADNNRNKVMTLSKNEFIRRFLLHVLPMGFVRIRYFGFLGQAVKTEQLQRCRELIDKQPIKQNKQTGTTDSGEKPSGNKPPRALKWRCPVCGKGTLIPYRKIPGVYHRNTERDAVA